MEKKKLVTHNGSYHADDVFAAAVLALVFEKRGEPYEIIRSRDEEIIAKANLVFDVGGIYDPAINRFDHHQPGGAGKRPSFSAAANEEGEENGPEYASFGLIWKHFGMDLCSNVLIWEGMDKNLVSPIDVFDNGIAMFEKKFDFSPYLIQDVFFALRPTWMEERNIDDVFFDCVAIAKTILVREIAQREASLAAFNKIQEIYEKSEDKKILVFDESYPDDALLNFQEVLFVVYPRKATNDWGVKTVRKELKTFHNRKDFPKEWGGLRDEELQRMTGVSGAIFCHKALFLTVAKDQESALQLAKLAVEN